MCRRGRNPVLARFCGSRLGALFEQHFPEKRGRAGSLDVRRCAARTWQSKTCKAAHLVAFESRGTNRCGRETTSNRDKNSAKIENYFKFYCTGNDHITFLLLEVLTLASTDLNPCEELSTARATSPSMAYARSHVRTAAQVTFLHHCNSVFHASIRRAARS